MTPTNPNPPVRTLALCRKEGAAVKAQTTPPAHYCRFGGFCPKQLHRSYSVFCRESIKDENIYYREEQQGGKTKD